MEIKVSQEGILTMIFALLHVRTCKVTKNVQEANVFHLIPEATNILYEILRKYTYLIQQ